MTYYDELKQNFMNFIKNYGDEFYLFEGVNPDGIDSMSSYYVSLWFDDENINIELWYDNADYIDENDCTFSTQISRADIDNEMLVYQVLSSIMIEVQKDITARRDVIKKKYEEDIADLELNKGFIDVILSNYG